MEAALVFIPRLAGELRLSILADETHHLIIGEVLPDQRSIAPQHIEHSRRIATRDGASETDHTSGCEPADVRGADTTSRLFRLGLVDFIDQDHFKRDS